MSGAHSGAPVFRRLRTLGKGRKPYRSLRIQFLRSSHDRRRHVLLGIHTCRRHRRHAYRRRAVRIPKIPSFRKVDRKASHQFVFRRFRGVFRGFVRSEIPRGHGFRNAAFVAGRHHGRAFFRRFLRRRSVFVPLGFRRRVRYRALRPQTCLRFDGGLSGHSRRHGFRMKPSDRPARRCRYGKFRFG